MWVCLGVYVCGYISISSSMTYRYVRYSKRSKSFFTRIHADMDNGARGALRITYAAYIPAAHRQ